MAYALVKIYFVCPTSSVSTNEQGITYAKFNDSIYYEADIVTTHASYDTLEKLKYSLCSNTPRVFLTRSNFNNLSQLQQNHYKNEVDVELDSKFKITFEKNFNKEEEGSAEDFVIDLDCRTDNIVCKETSFEENKRSLDAKPDLKFKIDSAEKDIKDEEESSQDLLANRNYPRRDSIVTGCEETSFEENRYNTNEKVHFKLDITSEIFIKDEAEDLLDLSRNLNFFEDGILFKETFSEEKYGLDFDCTDLHSLAEEQVMENDRVTFLSDEHSYTLSNETTSIKNLIFEPSPVEKKIGEEETLDFNRRPIRNLSQETCNLDRERGSFRKISEEVMDDNNELDSSDQDPAYIAKKQPEEEIDCDNRFNKFIVIENDTDNNFPTETDIATTKSFEPNLNLLLPEEPLPYYDHEVENKVPVIISKKRQKKQNFCMYCKKLHNNLARHLERRHKEEEAVKQFISLPRGSVKRKKILAMIRQKSNYIFNINRKYNNGELIVVRRPEKNKFYRADDYMPCPHCKAFYLKRALSRHYRKCNTNCKKNGRMILPMAKMTYGKIHSNASETLKRLFSVLRDSECIKLIRYDELAIAYGNFLCTKYSHPNHHRFIRTCLRYMGNLLVKLKQLDPTITDFAALMTPSRVNDVLKAIYILAGLKTNGQYRFPSTAENLKRICRTVAEVWKGECAKCNDLEHWQQTEIFLRHFRQSCRVRKYVEVNKPEQENLKLKSDMISVLETIEKINAKKNENNNCTVERDNSVDCRMECKEVENTPHDPSLFKKIIDTDRINNKNSNTSQHPVDILIDGADIYDIDSLDCVETVTHTSLESHNAVQLSNEPPYCSQCTDKPDIRLKQYLCIYCRRFTSKLPRHLEITHKEERAVKQFLSLPKDSKERQELLARIQKKGDFIDNTNRICNEGELEVAKRPNRNREIHSSACDVLKNHIFPFLSDSESAKIICCDDLAIAYGNLCTKHPDPKLYQFIRDNLRLMGTLLTQTKRLDSTITDFASLMVPSRVSTVIDAINIIAGLDINGRCCVPAVAETLGQICKDAAEVWRRECSSRNDQKGVVQTDTFWERFEEESSNLQTDKTVPRETRVAEQKRLHLESKHVICTPLIKCTRKRWSAASKQSLYKIFERHLENNMLPSNAECRMAMHKIPTLRSKTVAAIKTAVHNEIRRRKKQHSN